MIYLEEETPPSSGTDMKRASVHLIGSPTFEQVARSFYRTLTMQTEVCIFLSKRACVHIEDKCTLDVCTAHLGQAANKLFIASEKLSSVSENLSSARMHASHPFQEGAHPLSAKSHRTSTSSEVAS
jgi:hypothetical protein